MKRVAPTPAVPSISSVPDIPAAADWSRDASLMKASSRPTNRGLVYEAGMRGIVGAHHAPSGAASATLRGVTDGRRAPHPANELNELPGEEWLYFTKSVLTTAYPSELGHAARKAHGANKPPRLMARLIEFFSKSGELVLDPFAGVGGTLLGAAIARGPRRALGIELDARWAAVYASVVAGLAAEQDGEGPRIADLGTADPGGPRGFDPSGLELRVGDALAILPTLPDASVDLVATDPPYNIQLARTMAGGVLAETHANRRTDYAMVSDAPADLANAPDYATFLERMGSVFVELARVLRPGRYAVVIVRDAYQEGRYQFVGSDLAARADAAGLVPKGDLIWHQAGTRLRPYGYPRVFVPNIAHQHILVLRREPGPRQARRRLAR
jgi:DNA modification methylase